MPADKDKVNNILKEIQNILKIYKPNSTELMLINQKISQMTARNLRKQTAQPSSKRDKKQWHKIKID
jgi:hypothetical protein